MQDKKRKKYWDCFSKDENITEDFIEKIIVGFKYKGENFGERLENIPEDHLVNVAGIKQAHQVKNRIIHDDNFVLSKEDALGVLSQYEEFLRSFQVVD